MKFNILALREEEDGSLSADVDYDDEMAQQIRSHYNVEDITPSVLSQVVKELLEQYVAQLNGQAQQDDDGEQSEEISAEALDQKGSE